MRLDECVFQVTKEMIDEMSIGSNITIYISKEFEVTPEVALANKDTYFIRNEMSGKFLSGWVEKGFENLVNIPYAKQNTSFSIDVSETNESYAVINHREG